MRMPTRCAFRAAVAALALGASPAAAQEGAETGGFVVTADRDTVYLERYAVGEGVVAGEILRVGQDVTLYSIGSSGGLEISRRLAPPADRTFFQPFQIHGSGFGRYPILLDGSIGMLEHLVRRARREGRLSQRIPAVLVVGRQMNQETAVVTLPQPGYAEVSLTRQRLRFVLELDDSGRVRRGAETTRGWTFERVPDEWLRAGD